MLTWHRILGAWSLIVASLVVALGVGAQQAFPAEAVIRGENVWLRTDPAEETQVIAYLQRGDTVTITDEAIAGDDDEFYPVDVVTTGETGWVRRLFIDPQSIAPLVTAPLETEADTQERRPRPARQERRGSSDAPLAELPSRGLGMTEEQFGDLYGNPQEDMMGNAHAVGNGIIVAYEAFGSPVSTVERIFDTGVSFDDARAESTKFRPTDAVYMETFVSDGGVTVDMYSSEWLKEQFPNVDLWVNTEPGVFTVGYSGYNPAAGINEVTRWVMATGNNR